MPGHWGVERVTQKNLIVHRIDKEKNLIWVKGPVPGPAKGLLEIRKAVRLSKTKATQIAEAS